MKHLRHLLLSPVALLVAVGLALPSLASAQPIAKGWPSLAQQMKKDKIKEGTALERLVKDNQDFSMLRAEEATDTLRIPPWLRVHWRKAHPEVSYSAADPTGGYPLVLKEIYEWMLSHQDLLPGELEEDVPPANLRATVGANVRISGAQTVARSESDIRINYGNANQVIAGSNNIGGSGAQGMYYSLDGGANWGQTTLPIQTGDAFHSDPTVDWTSDGTAWSTTIGINSSATQLRMRSYRSSTQGQTWTFDNTFSGSQTNADKQLMWVDKSASSSFRDNIYACWHNGNPQYFNRRTGPSGSWGTPLLLSGSETSGTAIGCDVKSNSTGDVFVFWPATGNRRLIMAKSTNGGVSFATPVIITTAYDSYDIGVPAFASRRILIYISGGAYKNGSTDNVYAAWTDLSGDTGCTTATNEPGTNASSTCKTRIWFARSTNGGTTWSSPVKINNQAGLNDQFNQGLAVDETTGRISVIYYDTVADSTRKKTHVYYQTSTDNGATWSTAQQVTTAQTDETVAGADSGNQYGDYNSLSGNAGVFFPSWTDRRNGAREEIWTAKLTESGGGCTPPSAPTGLSATAVSSSQINLSWSAVSGATTYNVYRSTTSGGPYSSVGSSATTSFSNTGLSASTTYFYVVRAVAGCESGNSSQASATTQSGGGGGCTTQTLYSNGFESGTGLGDWSKGTFVSGGSTTSWRGIQTCTAAAGSKIFRFGGSSCTANYSSNNFNFAQPGGSAGISIPAGSSTVRLTFKHRRRFESGFDGGTLAVSTDGSSYTFVPSGAILSGAYNGTTSTSCPPTGGGGVPVYTGVSTTFTTTTVDLDAACDAISGNTGGCAGKSVRAAFTTITDCSVTDDGWFLDDVTVTACVP